MERELKRSGLAREALAGQRVAVLPLAHIVRDTALTAAGWRDAAESEKASPSPGLAFVVSGGRSTSSSRSPSGAETL